MNTSKTKRIKRTVAVTVLFALAAGAYFAVFSIWHVGIPCLFNKVTGLKCPGCGMTRGIAALFRFDIKEAARMNVFIFPSILYIAGIYLHSAYSYIKSGKHSVAFPLKYADIVFLVLLIIWWILRNIIKL